MSRSTLVVVGVVCLVLCATIPAPTSGPATVPERPGGGKVTKADSGTLRYLEMNHTDYVTQTVQLHGDIAASVAISKADFDGDEIGNTIQREYRAAEDNETNGGLKYLQNRTAALEREKEQLIQRQETAINRFYTNPTEENARRLLVELAIVDASAYRIGATAVGLEEIGPVKSDADNETYRTIHNRTRQLQVVGEMLRGPVRDVLLKNLRGGSNTPGRYYVQASNRGVIIATTEYNEKFRYKREAYLPTSSSLTNGTPQSDTRTRFKSRYGVENWNVRGSNWLEWVDYDNPDLARHVFIGSVSSRAVGERLIVNDKKGLFDKNKTSQGPLKVNWWSSMRGGPMQIEITHEDRKTPHGEVHVDGELVSTTVNGETTILQPAATANITIVTDSATFSIAPTGGSNESPSTNGKATPRRVLRR
ncbi:hypothetical protein [Halocatena halophila]|uniref:hypothetical protein n=1 Tax=Halocatena halophila TaxID=2814576 RepID=UPI002ED3C50B